MARHNDLGKWGEEKAMEHLRKEGYVIRHADWAFGSRDIDIIALTPDGTTLVFVEVKTRSSDDISKPADAITTGKIRNIGIAANAYVKEHDAGELLRFDIIAIVGDNEENMRLEHVVDAFNPLLI